ncbi:hypothetical protein [Streptomyces specialis]|uniref:hypothetical protein n=1 Tax=Streptomyces specialis TaxID=498367 RepID=UPI00073EF4EF|nr:hypothetical protein [Streptomyces specialis]
MTDRRRAPGQQDRPGEEDNPFAPPPEGEPDRPWRPRHPEGSDQDDQRQRWGSQWSRRQPKRDGGAFGEPKSDPGAGGPGTGPEQGGKPGPRGRWDPADPAQRHARYAVLAGMWGVFGGLLGWEWLGLLLGTLALYWGVSALRGGPKPDAEPRNRRLEALEGKPPWLLYPSYAPGSCLAREYARSSQTKKAKQTHANTQ